MLSDDDDDDVIVILLCTEEHYKQTPVYSQLPQQLGQLIVRSIAINSAYTSRVLVIPGVIAPAVDTRLCIVTHSFIHSFTGIDFVH